MQRTLSSDISFRYSLCSEAFASPRLPIDSSMLGIYTALCTCEMHKCDSLHITQVGTCNGVVCNRFIAGLLYCSFPSISSEEHAHAFIPSHMPRERDSNVYVLRHSGSSLIRHSQRTIFIVHRVVDHWLRTHQISLFLSFQGDF